MQEHFGHPMLLSLIVCVFITSRFATALNGNPEALTTFGLIRGSTEDVNGVKVDTYLGIPYAKPPTGENRFRKPLPIVKKFNETFLATKWPNNCPQFEQVRKLNAMLASTDEDCLYLNVWRKSSEKGTEPMPVLVYIHGGAFLFGGSSVELVDGKHLAALGNAVIVTINYRLGALGFLYGHETEAPGNMGLWDQHLALQWVKENIKGFGGDPHRITLAGESAGGWSVSIHIMSPIGSNLFQRAIVMSGVAIDGPTASPKSRAIIRTSSFAMLLGCRAKASANLLTEEEVRCMREADINTIVATTVDPEMLKLNPGPLLMPFAPVFGDEYLPLSPLTALASQKFKGNLSVLVGTVVNEGVVLNLMTSMFPSSRPKSKEEFIQKTLSESFSGAYGYPKVSEEVIRGIYFANVDENNLEDANAAQQEAMGTAAFDCTTNLFAERISSQNEVYRYVFAYPSETSTLCSLCKTKPGHEDDVVYTFGAVLQKEEEKVVSRMWQKFFLNFVNGGKMPVPNFSKIDQRVLMPYFYFNGSGKSQVKYGYKHYACLFINDALIRK